METQRELQSSATPPVAPVASIASIASVTVARSFPKPLSLKSEKAAQKLPRLTEDPFVDVLVKLPYQSAQEIYTYTLVKGAESASHGDLVSVPFGNQITEGVILSRYAQPKSAGKTKSILSLISKEPLFSEEQISLAQSLAKRYSCDTWSFLSSFSPPYSKSGAVLAREKRVNLARAGDSSPSDSELLPNALEKRSRSKAQLRDLIILPSFVDGYEILIDVALRRQELGKVVIVLADTKDLMRCEEILSDRGEKYLSITSLQKKSERFAHYMMANGLQQGIVLTLRNGIFLDLQPSDTLIVFNEAESHLYERRSPSWNARDIALMRSSNHSVIFMSHSPSTELVRQCESKWFSKYIFPTDKLKRATFLTKAGEDRSPFPIIEEGLKRGNVLISVARAGYINSFSCNNCRTIAQCSCGGKFSLPGSGKSALCNLCGATELNWSCPHCHAVEVRITSRGAARSAAEFGRAFPKNRVIHSSGSEQVQSLPDGNSLVVATLGSEPIGKYAAILILDAQMAYSQVALRAAEETRLAWFKMFSMLKKDGSLYISLPRDSTVAQGILRSDPYDLALREMNERYVAQLPPYYRIVIIEGLFSDLDPVRVLSEDRGFMPYLLASKDSKTTNSRMLIKFPVDRGEECSEMIGAIQRIRVARKKSPFTVKYDPYSID